MYIKQANLIVPKAELKELEDALPYGAKKEIAKRTGMHRNSIDDIFKGKWSCPEVIDAACDIIMESSEATKKKRIKIIHAIAS